MIDTHYMVLQVTSSGILVIKYILWEEKSYSKIVLCHTENEWEQWSAPSLVRNLPICMWEASLAEMQHCLS